MCDAQSVHDITKMATHDVMNYKYNKQLTLVLNLQTYTEFGRVKLVCMLLYINIIGVSRR